MTNNELENLILFCNGLPLQVIASTATLDFDEEPKLEFGNRLDFLYNNVNIIKNKITYKPEELNENFIEEKYNNFLHIVDDYMQKINDIAKIIYVINVGSVSELWPDHLIFEAIIAYDRKDNNE